jgi:hypothetical protein
MSDKLCYIVKSSHIKRDDWDWVRTELIERVVHKRGFRCAVGSPMETRPHQLERHIARLIQADLVIIDVTEPSEADTHDDPEAEMGDDPLVFYQLGVRHACTNRTILIARNEEDLEKDATSYYRITYSSSTKDSRRFREMLANALDQLDAHPQEPDNAVQRYLRGEGRAEQQAQQMKEQTALITRLQEKIESLEQEIASNPSSPRPDDRIEFKPV